MPSHCSSLLCARFRLSSLAVIVALAASGVRAEGAGSSPSAAEIDWRPRSELPPEVAGRLPVFCEGGYLPSTVGGDGAVVPGEGIEGSMPLEASALNARYELDSELYLQGDVRLRQGPFQATGDGGDTYSGDTVVIATGGKSIPKMGATGFGYDVAKHFGVRVVDTRPALVPLTFDPSILSEMKELSGVSVNDAVVSHGKTKFSEAMLFTHRGLSGPSILQISSFWREGDQVAIAMLPEFDVLEELKGARQVSGKSEIQTILAQWLPKKLVAFVLKQARVSGRLADLSDKKLLLVSDQINDWRIKPTGSEGYRTAEVTLGGVATNELENKTMEAKSVPGLYFIGEVVDMTGWLGGYNFQWAWASAHACAEALGNS